jgi:hypothetical protein
MENLIIDTNYTRVFPRDFFNEAKLLKCMGRLTLLIEDRMTPVAMSIGEYAEEGEEGFKIGLIETGHLAVANVSIFIKGKSYLFKTDYNAKGPYPFYVEDGNDEYKVFDDAGDWHEEFLEFCKSL